MHRPVFKTKVLLFSSLAFAAAGAQAATITTTVSGVYDEPGRANAVDASFSSAPTTKSGTGAAPTLLSVGTFATTVAAAYAAGLGGVMNFDDVTSVGSSANDRIDGKYGAGSLQTLSITGSTSYAVDMTATSAITATPISGANYLRMGNPVLTFQFSTPLQALGFTVLGRNTARTIGVSLTYTDGTVATYDFYSVGPSGNTSGVPTAANFAFSDTSANDTFFGYQAPAGLAITKFTFNAGGGLNPVLDDFGFIIPEPSSLLLSGFAMLGFLRRKR